MEVAFQPDVDQERGVLWLLHFWVYYMQKTIPDDFLLQTTENTTVDFTFHVCFDLKVMGLSILVCTKTNYIPQKL